MKTPTHLHLTNTTQSYTHTGTQDQLADPLDTDILLSKLKKHVVYHHEEPSFEHLDFTWSYKAADLIYPKLLELIGQFSGVSMPVVQVAA